MKLSDWAKTQGISYLTAYRWFKDGKLPVEAYQSESGTIIVKDSSNTSESPMPNNNQTNDSMSVFLKKTIEFSKSNSSVEDFAAYVLSNFSLKLNNVQESSPKYSKNKPKSEDIQKHFQQFLKSKDEGSKPKPSMFVTDSDTLDKLVANDEAGIIPTVTLNNVTIPGAVTQLPGMQTLVSDLASAISSPDYLSLSGNVTTYDSLGELEGVVSRTPQSTNYTNSIDSTFSPLNSSSSFSSLNVGSIVPQSAIANVQPQPSLKEIQVAHDAANKLASEIRSVVKSRRGRKPSKKVETK